MKFKALSLLFVVLACAYGCKDDTDGSGTPTPSATMSGTIQGQSWTARQISAVFMNNVLVVTGVALDGSTVTIRLGILAGFETSKYSLTYNSSSNVATYQETLGGNIFATNQYDGSNAIPGTVDVTKFDKTNKLVSGALVADVKRIADNQERSLNITFSNVKYSTEMVNTPNKTMSCKVDGTNWSANNVTAVKSNFTSSISVIGNAINGTGVSVTVPDDVTPGTYSIGTIPGLSDFLCQYNPTPSGFMTGYPGSVTITEHDDVAQVLKGSFYFTATTESDTVEITSGLFETTY